MAPEKSSKLYSKTTVLVSLAIGLLVAYLRHVERSPVVHTESGKIQGFVSTSRSGRTFYSFLGIPFAEPPVGKLRFESPEPVRKWNGTLDATKAPNECKSYDFVLTGRTMGDEDCLYMNIFTPGVLRKGESPTLAKKKVLVFIHGGAFNFGSARVYRPKFFMDHEDVVLVVIQYRLGIFGFLTSGDANIKGNMGLKDVVESLRWIKTNIAQFLGDPNDVIVVGESAGGGISHMLMLSPMAKGLFTRAVTWSCDAISDLWQLKRNSSLHFEIISSGFNCSSDSVEESAACIKAKNVDELIDWSRNLKTIETYENIYGFAPCIENHNDTDAFLTEHPLTLLKSGRIASPVPWLYGVNENEGLIMVAKVQVETELAENLDDDDYWMEHLPKVILFNSTKYPEAALKLKEYYFGNRTVDLSSSENVQALSTLITDKIFYQKFVTSARLQSRVSPVYLFHFSHKSYISSYEIIRAVDPLSFFPMEAQAFYANVKSFISKFIFWEPEYHYGTSHGDEIILLFDVHLATDLAVRLYDLNMSQQLVQTIVDFATTENLENFQYQGIPWPAIASDESKSLPVMDINLKGQLLEDPFQERLKFLLSLNLPQE